MIKKSANLNGLHFDMGNKIESLIIWVFVFLGCTVRAGSRFGEDDLG